MAQKQRGFWAADVIGQNMLGQPKTGTRSHDAPPTIPPAKPFLLDGTRRRGVPIVAYAASMDVDAFAADHVGGRRASSSAGPPNASALTMPAQQADGRG
jgi:hypothetical protein